MAEGGDDNRDNPFSFKKFSTNQTKNPYEEDSDGENEDFITKTNTLPDISDGLGRSEQDDRQSKTKREDGNPFSFRKFLETQGSSTRVPKASGISTLDLANDLPDFVQDHFTGDGTRPRNRVASDISLPDFTLDTDGSVGDFKLDSADLETNKFDNQEESLGLVSGNDILEGAFALPPRAHSPHDDLSIPNVLPHLTNEPLREGDIAIRGERNLSRGLCSREIFDAAPVVSSSQSRQPTSCSGLPDFLSDSTLNSASKCHDPVQNGMIDGGPPGRSCSLDPQTELAVLREENRRLRQELEETKQLSDARAQRIAEVLRDKEALQKRETEETASLEKIVQQVEANLRVTTERAVKAEKKVTNLQEEVHSLQCQVQSLVIENEALRCGECGDDPARRNATYVSQQLASAATDAEQKLKQLLGGVESLKLLSKMLCSIDKVSDAQDFDQSGATAEASGGS